MWVFLIIIEDKFFFFKIKIDSTPVGGGNPVERPPTTINLKKKKYVTVQNNTSSSVGLAPCPHEDVSKYSR